MLSSMKRLGGATLAGVLTLILSAPAQAQPRLQPNTAAINSPLFQVNPYLLNYGQNLAQIPPSVLGAYNPYASALTNPYLTGYTPLMGYGSGLPAASLTSNPYSTSPGMAPYSAAAPYGSSSMPYSPYTSYYDPYGGYYRGIGDLTKAYGQYAIDVNKARLINQQVERSKIETRRRLFDEWRYERQNMPTVEDLRQRQSDIDLRVARRQPQTTDILAARSLNDLLAHLKAMHGKGQRGTDLRLDEDLLKKINVKTDFGGNIGLLKNGGKLLWPTPLKADAFDELRKAFELHVEDAINRVQVNGKSVDFALITNLTNELRGMNDLLEKHVSSMNTGQYIDAKRYLNLLSDALRALQDPNVANYFNRKYEASGKTVADLVDNLRKEGLTFAPAVPGDEGAYRALQSFLAAYDDSVTRLAQR